MYYAIVLDTQPISEGVDNGRSIVFSHSVPDYVMCLLELAPVPALVQRQRELCVSYKTREK